MRHKLTGKALVKLIGKVGYKWSDTDNTIHYFGHDDNFVPPTEEQIESKIAELQADYDAKKYQRDRKYPELGEQFDLLFKDINEGTLDKTGGFYTAIKAVKDKHPKPSE